MYMYMCIYIYIHMSISISLSIHMYIYICIYIYTYTCYVEGFCFDCRDSSAYERQGSLQRRRRLFFQQWGKSYERQVALIAELQEGRDRLPVPAQLRVVASLYHITKYHNLCYVILLVQLSRSGQLFFQQWGKSYERQDSRWRCRGLRFQGWANHYERRELANILLTIIIIIIIIGKRRIPKQQHTSDFSKEFIWKGIPLIGISSRNHIANIPSCFQGCLGFRIAT